MSDFSPAKSMGEVFKQLDEDHTFNVILETFDTDEDKVRMYPEDYPYLRNSLIQMAVKDGKINKVRTGIQTDNNG